MREGLHRFDEGDGLALLAAVVAGLHRAASAVAVSIRRTPAQAMHDAPG
jgi:hypothetical protein